MDKNRNQILEAGSRGEEVLLTGIIVSGELDAAFKMISILLSTDQELDFLVEKNDLADELFIHLRELVRVKGFIHEDAKGRRTIRISNYLLLETEEGGMKAPKTKIQVR